MFCFISITLKLSCFLVSLLAHSVLSPVFSLVDFLLPFVFSFKSLSSSYERRTDLQQEHDRGHLPGSGNTVQRPQRAAGAAHASPP